LSLNILSEVLTPIDALGIKHLDLGLLSHLTLNDTTLPLNATGVGKCSYTLYMTIIFSENFRENIYKYS
jgi:hypothetical protein